MAADEKGRKIEVHGVGQSGAVISVGLGRDISDGDACCAGVSQSCRRLEVPHVTVVFEMALFLYRNGT